MPPQPNRQRSSTLQQMGIFILLLSSLKEEKRIDSRWTPIDTQMPSQLQKDEF